MVADTVRSWGLAALADAADALTGEIMSAAGESDPGHIEVACRRLEGGVQVEITDVVPAREQSPGRHRMPMPEAAACGIAYDGPTRTAWFRLDLPGGSRTASAPEEITLHKEAGQDASTPGWLGFLADASDLLAGTLDQAMLPAILAQVLVPRIATWCAVYTRETDGEMGLTYVWHANESRIDTLRERLLQTPLPETVTSGDNAPVLLRDPSGAVTLLLPLSARRRVLGVLVLGRPDRFPDEIAQLAEDLSHRAALALDNARLYAQQAATVRALQRSLLPPELPKIPGVDYSVVYEPAGEANEVGGDFYDLFACPGNRWRFAIGDVCGTGPEAAAVTGLARQTLRLLAREGYSVANVVARLNTAIIDQGPRARFLTLLYGEIARRSTGGLRLSLVCAGHPPPLRLSSDGEVTPLGDHQSLLGVFSEVTYIEEAVDLSAGEVLLAVTDGVTERRNAAGLLDDDDGLAKLFAECAGLSAGAVAGRIKRAVQDFTDEPPADDLAILALRAL